MDDKTSCFGSTQLLSKSQSAGNTYKALYDIGPCPNFLQLFLPAQYVLAE